MAKAVRKGKVFGHRETQTKTAEEVETLICSAGYDYRIIRTRPRERGHSNQGVSLVLDIYTESVHTKIVL